MCSTSVSFKWLDILEKEFDKAFVNIDLLLGEFDSEEAEILPMIRKKLGTMCSCFAQLSHKALTIFQMNCKAEAEIINLRSEVVEMKVQNQLLEKEMHSLLVQLHSNQLERLNLSYSEQKENIKDKLQRDLAQCSPIRSPFTDLEKKVFALENWKTKLQMENEMLRSTIVSLQADVCGARLAARYLDKELAGRIQQLQLLTRDDMNAEVRNKLWDQLDAEILLQRRKTVIKVMRQRKNHSTPPDDIAGRVRNVYVNREPHKGLGISITGGKEHGVPILISDLEPELSKKKLFVGDEILAVNEIDLSQQTHKEAVRILSNQFGNIKLIVMTKSTVNVSEIEEETNLPSYLTYPFFEHPEDEDFVASNKALNIPTASCIPPSCDSENFESRIETAIKPLKSEEVRSENELFGVTILQNIFRSISSIESSHKNVEEIAETKASVCKNISANDCCDGQKHGSPICYSNCQRDGSTKTNNVDSTKHIAAVLSPVLTSDKSVHSSVVNGIGDSNVGTPV